MTGAAQEQDVARIGRDPAAFEAFYREHVDLIQRFIARRVGDPMRAADLAADVFLAAIESAHTYRAARGGPTGWLFGVARNVLAAERRRNARGLRAESRVAGRALVDRDDVAMIEERIEAETRSRRLYRAMDELSGGERAVLELVALDGLTVQEAGRSLGIRPTAARVRLHRARRRLQHHLMPDATGEVAPPVEVLP
ncbi:RNA polymerase sigma factor [Amycolatopsis cihanbeyliensis]|uniref:RNA polymerase sigma-70 factor (ECF subfamily) n=1 Tax=Amycolatopsis cihanbeyliensis TaxID=1128664 RepID=A0A542CUH1_AMYCI|nr:RNA polymerase sigma factor [Amycolatopsis cihanbeyliensis]TQI94463.1 RNA polymerase sigma-70 factor (ECF subfamily) [Amycolatopsis cihanbeyliensis]